MSPLGDHFIRQLFRSIQFDLSFALLIIQNVFLKSEKCWYFFWGKKGGCVHWYEGHRTVQPGKGEIMSTFEMYWGAGRQRKRERKKYDDDRWPTFLSFHSLRQKGIGREKKMPDRREQHPFVCQRGCALYSFTRHTKCVCCLRTHNERETENSVCMRVATLRPR